MGMSPRALRQRPVTARVALLGLVLSCACDAPHPDFDRVALLRETATEVIVPAYASAADRAAGLEIATQRLCDAPDAATLEDAQHAWLDAFVAWRRTRALEVVGEGLVVTTLEGELTTVARIDLIEAHIAGAEALDGPDYVAALGGASKGFFALEYLLFGYPALGARDDARTLAALSDARRCTYARVLAADIADLTARARDDWSADGGNFVGTFTAASPSVTYDAPGRAIDDLLSAIATALDRTRDEGLARPLGLTMHAGSVESPYARASVQLMQATLEGVHDVWTVPSHGLDALVRSRDPLLADRVLSELEAARTALAALASPPAPLAYEDYVHGTDHEAGNAAYDAVATLLTTLATDVSTTLGIRVTALVDGD
jgi:predicted lipoprotein